MNKIDKYIINDYRIDINSNDQKEGYVYFVTSDLLNAIKIGMWRSNINSLYKRYKTVYGNDITIEYFYTENARKLEKIIHTKFDSNKITNELFSKNEYYNYILFTKQYLTNN